MRGTGLEMLTLLITDGFSGAGFVDDVGGLESVEETDEGFASFDAEGGFGFCPGEGVGEAGGAFTVGLGKERCAADTGIAERLGFVGIVDAFDVDRREFAGEFDVTA